MPRLCEDRDHSSGGGEECDMSTTSTTTTTTQISQSHHFVLVHGIGGGGWCWYKIKCLLESCGHEVSCIDLKSAGTDPSDPDSVLTFEDYNAPLIDFLSNLPEEETQKVILVGHSAGGMSVTHALHTFGSNKIHLAIYVGATMLRSGFWTEEDFLDGVPDLSEFGDVYDLSFGLGFDQPPTSAVVKKEFQRNIIYQMCPLEDSTLASILLKPGPLRALEGAKFSENVEEKEKETRKVDEVERIYIKTSNDRVVRPEQQNAMIKRWPPSHVFVIETDHSPFFSAPFTLFGFLIKAAALKA